MVDLFIKNARVVTHQAEFSGGLSILDGKILEVYEGAQDLPAKETIDLGGKTLLPGLVDAHVHFNSPGRDDWEGAMYGSFAAAAGGVTTALEMPFNADPPTRNAALLEKKYQAVDALTVIDIGLWGLLEDSNLDELEPMHEHGAVAFKAFLCDPGGMFGWPRQADLLRAFEITRKLGALIGVHAENEELGQVFTDRVMQTGRTDRAAWGESHPPAVEFEALQLAIAAARQTGGDLHIVHTTIPQGFATIHAARSEGVKVTGETCPHYLYFNDSDLERIGPEAKCGPPLRPAEIVEQLWQEVMAGRVDTIGSDHCPCPPEMKNAGQENIWKAWGGITGIQAMLPVLLTEGYHRRGLSLSEVVKMTSWNPARRFGLYPKKGNLNPGADADFTVVDLDREWTFSDQDMLSRYPLSPYRGAHFKGAVLSTYVRGQKVFENGKITVEPGYGEVLRRCSADSFFEQA